MNLQEVVAYIVKALQQEQIRFGIGGSLLLAHHGLPSLRATSISSLR